MTIPRGPASHPSFSKKADALRLGSEKQPATGSRRQRTEHQLAPDSPSLVLWINQNLRNSPEEIAIGQNPDCADEPLAVPRTDIRRASQRCRRRARSYSRGQTRFARATNVSASKPSSEYLMSAITSRIPFDPSDTCTSAQPADLNLFRVRPTPRAIGRQRRS